jgi:DNA topoisomerase-3
MKTLVIAEKPDMGRTLAAVVEPQGKNYKTYIEGTRYIITWAIGHLLTLAEPDRYDAKYKRWRAADLPILPEQFLLEVNKQTSGQLKVIGELAQRCGQLVNACDAGREGQLIFHYIRQYLRLRQPVSRLWISDLTEASIRRGFASLRSDTEYANLTKAARARSEADWLIGMNASRAFTLKAGALLTIGRVQTPVLALLYDRDQEIKQFVSQDYYMIEGQFVQGKYRYKGNWLAPNGILGKCEKREEAEQIAAQAHGQTGVIAHYQEQERREYPGKLYDLTLLQREANSKFGFSAKKTLEVAQKLYEKHKLITYPRTSSNYVTEETVPQMHCAVDMLRQTQRYGEWAAGAEKGRVHKGNHAVVLPAKVEDHHALLPTVKRPNLAAGSDEERIYDLIVRRMLAHFYPPAVYLHVEWISVVNGQKFRTRLKQLRAPGFRVLYRQAAATDSPAEQGIEAPKRRVKKPVADEEGEVETDDPILLDPQAPVTCKKAEAVQKKTQPPKSYTEGTLLKAMESAGKTVEQEELREALKEHGLGTPATRAATIERLKQVGYMTERGRKLTVTEKGRATIETVRAAGVRLLTSAEMTGYWEQRLYQISQGEASAEVFMRKVREFTMHVVASVSAYPLAPHPAFVAAAAERKASSPWNKQRKRSAGSRPASSARAGARAKSAHPSSHGTPPMKKGPY